MKEKLESIYWWFCNEFVAFMFFMFICAIVSSGCSRKTYSSVEVNKADTVNVHKIDTVYIHKVDSIKTIKWDSIYVERNDSQTLIDRWHYISDTKTKIDTLYKYRDRDSIQIQYRDSIQTKTQTIEKKYIPSFYKWCTGLFISMLIIILIYFGYKLYRKFRI